MRKTLPRAACAPAFPGASSSAQSRWVACRSQFAALPEQRPEQVMRIGIVRFELQHVAVRAFRTFCVSGALAPVSTL
jgi:hypothetical protein